MSPKYKLGKKRYGRRSLPVTIEDLDDMHVLDEEDIEVASSTKSLRRSLTCDEDESNSEEVGAVFIPNQLLRYEHDCVMKILGFNMVRKKCGRVFIINLDNWINDQISYPKFRLTLNWYSYMYNVLMI